MCSVTRRPVPMGTYVVQLFAEQVKEREVKERLALLHLERDALLIDLSELRAKRNGVGRV